MSDCHDYTPTPAPATTAGGGGDPGFDVEVANLGCVLDVDGTSLGPVFYEPTFDAETGAYTGSILVHIPNSTGVPVRPYAGPWGPCPADPTSQYITDSQEFCALVDGAGYVAGDRIRLSRIVDAVNPFQTPRVQNYANLSAGIDQIIYLEADGVPVFGTLPPVTDFGECTTAGCTDCADVPAGSVV